MKKISSAGLIKQTIYDEVKKSNKKKTEFFDCLFLKSKFKNAAKDKNIKQIEIPSVKIYLNHGVK